MPDPLGIAGALFMGAIVLFSWGVLAEVHRRGR
jgi:hypothetical protein